MIKILYCKYFLHVINDLYLLLNKNKINVQIVDVCNLDDDIYFIFNAKDITIFPVKYVLFNFEQLNAIRISESFIEKFKSALIVIDYSVTNVEFLTKYNVKSLFIPYSWLLKMKCVINNNFNARINNVMFIGHLNERRVNCLRPVHQYCKMKNYNMFISNDCWDEYQVKMMSITKIALNIHFYDNNTILEVHRIIPYIMNKIIVITEKSNDPYYDEMMDDVVTWSEYGEFHNKINEILELSNEEIEELLLFRQKQLILKKSYLSLLNENLSNILTYV